MNSKIQYLVEGILKDILNYIMDDMHTDVNKAISMFYNSNTYTKLNNPPNLPFTIDISWLFHLHFLQQKF